MTTKPSENLPAPLAVLAAVAAGGNEIPILSPVATIGQGAQNDIVLDDDTVSTNHARLEYAANAWQLIDLESRNGTFVNQARLAPGVATAVPDGAKLAFGLFQTEFRTRQGADPEAVRQRSTSAVTEKKLADRAGFRLPLWVMLLIILLAAVAMGVFFAIDRAREPNPATQPIAAITMPPQFAAAA